MARRTSLAAAACGLLLAGCGFEPVYGDRTGTRGPQGSVQRHLAAIEVGIIADRIGQLLRNELISRLRFPGHDEAPLYQLNVTLTESEERLNVRLNATETRADLAISASYSLLQKHDGWRILRDSVRTVNSFTIQDTTEAIYSTIVAREDARIRGLKVIADRIVNHVSLTFAETIDR